MVMSLLCSLLFFFFNDTATTEISTLSLHDALPIYQTDLGDGRGAWAGRQTGRGAHWAAAATMRANPSGSRLAPPTSAPSDRKSTRLNSSHAISRMPSSA